MWKKNFKPGDLSESRSYKAEMTQASSEKRTPSAPIATYDLRSVLRMLYRRAIEDSCQVSPLTKSMVTKFLHTAKIGISICDASVQ